MRHYGDCCFKDTKSLVLRQLKRLNTLYDAAVCLYCWPLVVFCQTQYRTVLELSGPKATLLQLYYKRL